MTSSKSLTGFINKENELAPIMSQSKVQSHYSHKMLAIRRSLDMDNGSSPILAFLKLTRGDGVSYTAGIISDTSLPESLRVITKW